MESAKKMFAEERRGFFIILEKMLIACLLEVD